jgi:prepilin-type N-terminal cleavage/methylation domain-containing protein
LTSAMVTWIWVHPSYGVLLVKCNNLCKTGGLRRHCRSRCYKCRPKMKLSANFVPQPRSPRNGFSMVELVLSLAVLLIITVIAVPVVVRSLQTYQLNSNTSQLAGMLKFAKFDAIRQNTPVSCQVQQQGANWLVWVDSNGNGVADQAEPQMYIGGVFTLLPESSVPSPAPIQSSLGVGSSSYAWTVLSGAPGTVTYDQRGVLGCVGNATCNTSVIYVLYLGSSTDPRSGYRAVLTLPSGAVQAWSSSSAGDWHRIS